MQDSSSTTSLRRRSLLALFSLAHEILGESLEVTMLRSRLLRCYAVERLRWSSVGGCILAQIASSWAVEPAVAHQTVIHIPDIPHISRSHPSRNCEVHASRVLGQNTLKGTRQEHL